MIQTEKFEDIFFDNLSSNIEPLGPTNNDEAYYDCCATPHIIVDRGLRVCVNCAVDHGAIMKDYVSYDIMANNLHTNKKLNNPQYYYGSRTVFYLENLSPRKKALFRRLLRLNGYFSNSYESNMTIANHELSKAAGQLEIPSSIRRIAKQLYIKVFNRRLTVGRSIKRLVIASLYIACLVQKFQRRVMEFSDVTKIPVKILRKNYRLILRELNIRVKRTPASDYLSQFAIELGLPISFQTYAKRLITEIASKGFNENCNPRGFASAALYVTSKDIMSGIRVKQKTLSKIAGLSEVTLRKYIKILRNNIDFVNLK